MENNNINRFKLNDSDYVPTSTYGICECGSNPPDDIKLPGEFSCEAGSNLPDDIKLPGEFPCEAREKTNLMVAKSIVTQFNDETKKDLAKKWKEFGKINTPQQSESGYIQDG